MEDDNDKAEAPEDDRPHDDSLPSQLVSRDSKTVETRATRPQRRTSLSTSTPKQKQKTKLESAALTKKLAVKGPKLESAALTKKLAEKGLKKERKLRAALDLQERLYYKKTRKQNLKT